MVNQFGMLLGSSPFGLVLYTLRLQEDLLHLIKIIPSKNRKEVEYLKFGCAVYFHSQGKLF